MAWEVVSRLKPTNLVWEIMIFFWNNCAFSTESQKIPLFNEKRASMHLSWNSAILIGSKTGQLGWNSVNRSGPKRCMKECCSHVYTIFLCALTAPAIFIPLRHGGWRKTREIVRSQELDCAFNNLDYSRIVIRPQLINDLELFMCVRSHYLASTLDRPKLLCKLMGWGLKKSFFGSRVTCPTCEKPIFRL
jgi:hypothetical protein